MYKLSPSSLNLYLECPRCFWLRLNKGIHRPEGASSTLPRGMDFTLKVYYDKCRSEGLPKELSGKIDGKLLPNQVKVADMRKPSFGFNVSDNVWFGGALDEAVELQDGSIVPLDNKTKGFPPKEAHWTHIKQVSGYTLILREKGYKTKNLAYLVHWFFDHKNINLSDPFGFNVAIEQVETKPDDIKKDILEAVGVLQGDIPSLGNMSGPNSDEPCHYCEYRENLHDSI